MVVFLGWISGIRIIQRMSPFLTVMRKTIDGITLISLRLIPIIVEYGLLENIDPSEIMMGYRTGTYSVKHVGVGTETLVDGPACQVVASWRKLGLTPNDGVE